ncbi:hypothetical protein B4135_3138 [Caldibacillus debilis]|uniref:Uncharacterized protein n=1 Tax=Caldibacillus debilis TaxID=301148 RepID=A0A150LJ17_9BACI|nr:hypothetical protein B4135_3138 [Caldibacillus debilis]
MRPIIGIFFSSWKKGNARKQWGGRRNGEGGTSEKLEGSFPVRSPLISGEKEI